MHFSVYVNAIQKTLVSNLIFTLLTPVGEYPLLSYTFNGSHYFRSDFVSVRICWCPRAIVGDRTQRNPDIALSIHPGCRSCDCAGQRHGLGKAWPSWGSAATWRRGQLAHQQSSQRHGSRRAALGFSTDEVLVWRLNLSLAHTAVCLPGIRDVSKWSERARKPLKPSMGSTTLPGPVKSGWMV